MAKLIKIVQPGWEGFTGDLAQTRFTDGVSEGLVSPLQFNAIAASVAIVEIDEDGKELGSPGVQDNMQGAAVVPAPKLTELPRASDADLKADAKREAEKKNEVDPTLIEYHTKAQLEAIAETKGISGLRGIADPIGARGRSINDLIKEILKTEAKVKAQADALNASTETTREPVAPVTGEDPNEIVEEKDAEEKDVEEPKQALLGSEDGNEQSGFKEFSEKADDAEKAA